MSENSETVVDRASLREADLPDYVGIGLDRIVLVDTDALAEEALAALVVLDPGRHREAIAMLERWRDERGSPGARRGRR